MATNYVLPQVQVFQEFTAAVAAIVEPLRAFIAGPHFQLVRYDTADERATGALGAYNPDASEESFSWPGRAAGAIVDLDYTKLTIQDAKLKYFEAAIGGGSTNQVVWNGAKVHRNRVHLDSVGLVDYTNPLTEINYPRDAQLLRDVRLGDVVEVTDGADTVEAVVTGFEHEQTASDVAAATSDDGNQGTQSAGTSWTRNPLSGTVNLVTLELVDGSSYDGLADGAITETYTLECLQGSVGGDPSTAVFRLTSASGLDDDTAFKFADGSAFDALMDIGTRGAQVLFTNGASGSYGYGSGGDEFVPGQKWSITVSQQYAEAVPTSNAGDNYTGPSDTTYVIECTTGGQSGAARISVTTTTGVDSGGPYAVPSTTSTAIAIGRYGVTVSFNVHKMAKGEKFYVVVSSAKDAAIETLVLSRNLTDDMVGTDSGSAEDLGVTLYMKRTIEVPDCSDIDGAQVLNWVAEASQFTVYGSIQVYQDDWLDGSGDPQPLPVRYGTLYLTYRALRQTYASGINTITDIGEVATLLGPPVPDNPLALGVFKALTNANGTEVKFQAVPTNDLAGYSEVVKNLVGRVDTYSLVPLTFDRDVIDLFAAHVDAMSTPDTGRWRILWLGAPFSATVSLTGQVLGKIQDDPNTSGTQYTQVVSVGASFVTAGVAAGDELRTNYRSDACGAESYESYVVDSVVNEDTLLLTSGPGLPFSVNQRMEVWRTRSKDEIAAATSVYAGTFSNRRVRVVWPDPAGSGGVSMASYYVAAALAGLRSGVVPHQGLTNVELAGFDDVRVDFLGASQLNEMAGNGVWIVTQDPRSGTIYTRHQITTGDYGVITSREDSVVTNVDSISYYFLSLLEPFIGKANITPSTLAMLETQIASGISTLKSNGFSPLLGGQLIDGSITQLAAHPTLRDRLLITVSLTIPFALNNIELRLVI